MSTVAIVVIVIAAILLGLFLGGLLAARRRRNDPRSIDRIRAVDRQLEQARANDRGWDREAMAAVAGHAISEHDPGFEWETIELVLVDDRPGVTEDRAELRASGPRGQVGIVLSRGADGQWFAERVG